MSHQMVDFVIPMNLLVSRVSNGVDMSDNCKECGRYNQSGIDKSLLLLL